MSFYSSVLRRRLMVSQKAVLYTIAVTATGNLGNDASPSCSLVLDGVNLTASGTYTARAGAELVMGLKTNNNAMSSQSKITIDGTSMAQGNGATYTHIIDSHCSITCTTSGSIGYSVKANITLTRSLIPYA